MSTMSKRFPERILIMGAAGRDFHNFNLVYRDDPAYRVVGFTAAQIPEIAGRRYPPSLAGALYPEGIPVYEEQELETLIAQHPVEQVVFAYSDVSHSAVMHVASRVLAAGADFVLLGPRRTMLKAPLPVIAISAVRTGCGKSQTARWVARRLRARGLRVAVLRHPMPYGNLDDQAVQRFATLEDLDRAQCTVEEREEYEPHIAAGNLVFAGVDYERIVAAAAAEADLIVWDGGNNDFPFLRPDLHIVLADPLRAGDELNHHPGEAVVRLADVVVLAKSDVAEAADVARVTGALGRLRPDLPVIRAASPVTLESPELVRGRRVLVVEDGPTLTHGGMSYGAGFVAARNAGAAEIVDPRPAADARIAEIFRRYPHIGRVLPAVGYSAAQLDALGRTINAVDADVVVAATPSRIADLVAIDKPVVRARYEYADIEDPGLGGLVDDFVSRHAGRT
ncbi:MAG: cyclic 2,3-diphosphoglycerate synthase [Pseudomonadota bacterium]